MLGIFTSINFTAVCFMAFWAIKVFDLYPKCAQSFICRFLSIKIN